MNKNYLTGLFVALLLITNAWAIVPGPELSEIKTTISDVTARFEIPGSLEFTKGEFGYEVALDGFASVGAPGEPGLPAHSLRILLPEGVVWDSMEISLEDAQWESVAGNYDLAPMLPARVKIDGQTILSWDDKDPGMIVDGRDMTVYGVDADFPPVVVKAAETGEYRNWNLLIVALHPVTYNPMQQTLRLLRSGVVRVSFDAVPGGNKVIPADVEHFWAKLESTLVNPESRHKLYPDDHKGMSKDGIADYIIITTEKIRNDVSAMLDAFVQHKTEMGFRPRIVVNGAVADDFHYVGGSTALQRSLNIRDWLQSNYLDMGIVSVLLIGDPRPSSFSANHSVPMLNLTMPASGQFSRGGPTDMHFSELSGSWDLNGNGVYGEWTADFGPGGIDRFCEVNVGRIPYYGTAADLNSILQKSIDYEQAGGDQDWRKSVLIAAAVSNFRGEDNSGGGDGTMPDGRINIASPQLGAPWGERVKNLALSLGYGGDDVYTLYEKKGPTPGPGFPTDYYHNYAFPTTACNAPLTRDNFRYQWASRGYGFAVWFAHASATGVSRVTWNHDTYTCSSYPECDNISAYDRIAQGRNGRHGALESSFTNFWANTDASLLDDSTPSVAVGASCNLADETRTSTNVMYRLLQNGTVGCIMPSRITFYSSGGTWNPTAQANNAENAAIAYYTIDRMAKENDSIGEALVWMRGNFGTNWGMTSWSNLTTYNVYGDPAGSPKIYNSSPPEVVSITRGDPSPTNADSVAFLVAFNKVVEGVDTGDFVLDTVGITGAAITSISDDGIGRNYVVTVTTGTGTGTLRLDLIDDDSIIDRGGNPLGGVGVGNGNRIGDEYYVIDNIPPVITLDGGDMTIECGDDFVEPGFEAHDDPEGDISHLVVVTGFVDTALLGTYTLTYAVSDSAGNAASPRTRMVSVVDTTPPTILACMEDLVLPVGANCLVAVPNFVDTILAEDNCTSANALAITQSPEAGTLVGEGVYNVTITAEDEAGLTDECAFVLTIKDTTAPVITVPPVNHTISVDGTCNAVVPDFTLGVMAHDNCTASGSLIISQVPQSGIDVSPGIYIVTISVTDMAGNTTSLERVLAVEDTTPPVITSYPANREVEANAACLALVPDFLTDLVALDNCTGAEDLVLYQAPTPGTLVGITEHIIYITVEDGAGNIREHQASLVVTGDCLPASSATDTTASLNTVSPKITAAEALDERSVAVNFSETLLPPNDLFNERYALSGLGRGTLTSTPHGVGGQNPYTLFWDEPCEMRDGVSATVTVTGLQDIFGNPIHPEHASAHFTGIGIAPVFYDLTVTPSQASSGETVTLSFMVSEPLMGDPLVQVNGREASPSIGPRSVHYTYTYEVGHQDAPGLANITLSGFDLAGNPGDLSVGDALEILAPFYEVPLRAWPLSLALGFIGMVLVVRRGRRKGAALMLAAVLALSAPVASADAPEIMITGVIQRPNEAGSTQVDIFYDLDAPHGSCDISVWMSRNGEEEFIPALAVSGDLEDMVTGENYHIVWNIRADVPEEDLPNARIRLATHYGLAGHSLTYLADRHGQIVGQSPQPVYPGLDGAPVMAVPDEGYHFVQWSDGLMDAGRTDTNITENISVMALFAINHYPVTFVTDGTAGAILVGDPTQSVTHGSSASSIAAQNTTSHHFVKWTLEGADYSTENPLMVTNVSGPMTLVAVYAINQYPVSFVTDGTPGTALSGSVLQIVAHGGNTTAVTANEPSSHHFVKWTLNGVDYSSQGTIVLSNVTAPMDFTAIYDINSYTLRYTTGMGGTIVGDSIQTVRHGSAGTPVEALPIPGYYFVQWSDGSKDSQRTDAYIAQDMAFTAIFSNALPAVTSFSVDSGVTTTINQEVTLGNTATNSPTHYIVSEHEDFRDADWHDYTLSSLFELSAGFGEKTIYFKVKNPAGESNVESRNIERVTSIDSMDMVPVAAGLFDRGRPYAWDPSWGSARNEETPVHDVLLSDYLIGKYSVTVQQYCDVLNWSLAENRLYSNAQGDPWTGSGNIFAGEDGARYVIVAFSQSSCSIQYTAGMFSPKTRSGMGGLSYSMGAHPVQQVTWYGAAAFCNWLTEMKRPDLTPIYNMSSANWPLVVSHTTPGYGYRLPTEAEWERAAGWGQDLTQDIEDPLNTFRHWYYAYWPCESPNDVSPDRANCDSANPLGLSGDPGTSPVGWFNGINISPNGNVQTMNSVSPVGCYDMSGNAWDHVQDWYGAYGSALLTDPVGPASGTNRVYRGGSYWNPAYRSHTAARGWVTPTTAYFNVGMRVALTPTP